MLIDSIFQFRDWRPPYKPTAIIEDRLLLPETALFLFGSAKAWKTWHSLHLAFCIASGKPWFGYEVKRATVFRYQAELTKWIDQERTFDYAKLQRPNNIFFKTPEENTLLDTTWGMKLLIHDIEEVQRRTPNQEDPLVIILDPIYLLMQGDPSDGQDTKRLILQLREIMRKYHATFIIIHHARLTKTDHTGTEVDMGFEEIMGSSYWGNFCDTMLRSKLLNQYTGANETKVSFLLHRNAKKFHPAFIVRWDRRLLEPEVIQRDIIEDDEPTVRDFVGGE